MIVEILLPTTTFEKTRYKLEQPLELVGIKVPAGFITDGASVPRALWWLFPPTGRYFQAAVVHDYLLSLGFKWGVALAHFRKALQESGVKPWVVKTMVTAVRFHGWVRRYR